MSRNQDFAFLHYDRPPDIARRKAAGDLKGAIRLIDIALGKAQQPELAARLRCERVRLERLPRQDVCLRDLPCVPDWLRPLCLPC